MKSKEMDLFEKFWIDHTGCGADDFCFYEGCYTCEYMQDAWVAWQSQQAKIDELQARIDVYELHTKTLKNIHDNDFKEHSESSYILGNLDGFFECLESDLKGNKDE